MSNQKIESKREREKRTVSLMIRIYCKRSTEREKVCVPNVKRLTLMQGCGATNVLSWKQRPFAQIARYIATKQI